MKKILFAIAALSFSNTAMASPVYIDQAPFQALGAFNTLTISTADIANFATGIGQTLDAVAARPGATIQQSGNSHYATILQSGTGNAGLISQAGILNSATLAQTGTGNVGLIQQIGYGHLASITQTGSNHRAAIIQQGTGNVAIIRQW